MHFVSFFTLWSTKKQTRETVAATFPHRNGMIRERINGFEWVRLLADFDCARFMPLAKTS